MNNKEYWWECTDDCFEEAICPFCKSEVGENYGYASHYMDKCPICGHQMEELPEVGSALIDKKEAENE